ncbi:transcriptional adapter ADA2b [Malania oleifera]|uniref:transcriptional adapter ADA2b n=1 Tax=Malania oleifera TaxID=397392 RepID=UPI0025AE3865|nr:transcriptional adapter ADA2b [Malania oleifera]
MGRSRGVFHSADDDPTQRSRRKKSASTGENLESASAGQGTGEKRAYHCNYCNKDITGKIRIKCAVCSDFDLCIECFSVGAEVTPHKSDHRYRVMDNLSFPLICPDWNADDEILLLEGIEMYGLGNWAEVAEHVGTKSKEHCIDHYTNVYLNSPYFPLPDMSHVAGKNRKELFAMAKGQGEDKKGFSLPGELTLKEESLSPSRVKIEDSNKGGSLGQLLSSSNADLQTDQGFKGKRPSASGNEGPLIDLSGYNPKRQEFDPEYDNDAEQLLAEMDFKETDTEEERALKLRVLRIYSKRLDERKRRKDFILERNLLYSNLIEEDCSLEEKEVYRHFDVFMRFHSKEEHKEFLQSIITEHRIQKRIKELKEARSAGCRSPAGADRYIEIKRKREAEESARRVRESNQLGPSSQGGVNVSVVSESVGKEIEDSVSGAAGQVSSGSVNGLDIMEFPGVDLLSETEKRLCRDVRLPPSYYLKMQEIISIEIFSGNVTKKADAHCLFKVEPSKVDRVYEMLVKKGIAPP